MIFAGKQSMDIRTEDHAASADTDALQYGLSARLGKAVALGKRLECHPKPAFSIRRSISTGCMTMSGREPTMTLCIILKRNWAPNWNIGSVKRLHEAGVF